MRSSLCLIAKELKLLQLWNGDLQALRDLAEPRAASSILGLGHLFQEVGAKRVIVTTYVSVGFSYKLGDKMDVADCSEEVCQIAK
ncbi:hypothetical protein X771_01755 [Mesorhizobium sp. LSJC277A00]|nr:hypothetical protein X771_01755 [Mesorhizobium sp. LSJC277A00]